jgi:hypothetical protein
VPFSFWDLLEETSWVYKNYVYGVMVGPSSICIYMNDKLCVLSFHF